MADISENETAKKAIAVTKVIGSVAFMFLLDMADSVPLVPGIKNVAVRFCELVKSAYEDWEEFKEFLEKIEYAGILKLYLKPLNDMKDSHDADLKKIILDIQIEQPSQQIDKATRPQCPQRHGDK